MSRSLFLIVTLSLFSTGTLVSQPIASAETPLTKATVQALRNQVQLIFKNRVTRAAQTADTMTPGDSLATARQAFAELRFNDNSLARIGERTLFQFVPNTRNFYLGNGTALLLIPPGQGRTNVRTPNAAAGIRGSALFVRYNEDTNTTIVGALTNSRIEVSNGENSQAQTLKAGQLAVIIQNQVVQIYNFDLSTFYQTSALVRDLDLPLRNAAPSADPGIAAVQAETAQALREQTPLAGQISENPAFVSLNPVPGLQTGVTPGFANQITLTPSGFDLSTARQTLIANPYAQTFTVPVAGAQPGVATPPTQLSIPDPASVNAMAGAQLKPITLPTMPSSVIQSNPAVSTPSLPTPPVTAAAPIQPTSSLPSTAVSPGSTTTQPSTPTTTLPAMPSPVTTAQPPTPVPVPVVITPAPTPVPVPVVTTRTPIPVTTPISNPIARPDPVATPAPTPVTQIAPTLTSPAADTPVVQTTIAVPTPVVTPTAPTVQVQTGTAGTSVQVQTGTTGGTTVTPISAPSTPAKP